MKVSGGSSEQGIIYGNTHAKHEDKNLISRLLVSNFDNSLIKLMKQTKQKNIHEIGCGEGLLSLKLSSLGCKIRGSDFSANVIEIAKENAASQGVPPDIFSQKSIYNLDALTDSADLILCCEVLEHLEDPRAGLKALEKITSNYILLSVPREPLWRALNLLRGSYIKNMGNTPGHLQHWSKHGFVRLISEYFDVIKTTSPIPWTMVLAKKIANKNQ